MPSAATVTVLITSVGVSELWVCRDDIMLKTALGIFFVWGLYWDTKGVLFIQTSHSQFLMYYLLEFKGFIYILMTSLSLAKGMTSNQAIKQSEVSYNLSLFSYIIMRDSNDWACWASQ